MWVLPASFASTYARTLTRSPGKQCSNVRSVLLRLGHKEVREQEQPPETDTEKGCVCVRPLVMRVEKETMTTRLLEEESRAFLSESFKCVQLMVSLCWSANRSLVIINTIQTPIHTHSYTWDRIELKSHKHVSGTDRTPGVMGKQSGYRELKYIYRWKGNVSLSMESAHEATLCTLQHNPPWQQGWQFFCIL